MMKKAEMQEQEFLEICSSYDYDLLTNKIEMTLKDYQRITYLVGSKRKRATHAVIRERLLEKSFCHDLSSQNNDTSAWCGSAHKNGNS